MASALVGSFFETPVVFSRILEVFILPAVSELQAICRRKAAGCNFLDCITLCIFVATRAVAIIYK